MPVAFASTSLSLANSSAPFPLSSVGFCHLTSFRVVAPGDDGHTEAPAAAVAEAAEERRGRLLFGDEVVSSIECFDARSSGAVTGPWVAYTA